MGSAGSTKVKQTAFRGRIGVSRFDITPPVGIYSRMWGAALHETAEGIHRPLTGTAMTFASDGDSNMLVLVSLDLGWWRTADDEQHVRNHVLTTLGLKSHQLVIALTHTHSGPSVSRSHADRPGGQFIEPYLEKLRASIVAAIEAARETATDASLAWATGRCALAGNRHQRTPEGERVIVGHDPSVEADDTLLVGRVTSQAGKVLGTIVNYACHLTTLGPTNRLISPDLVGAMREVVEQHSHDAPCLFLQGASGELAPRQQYTDDVAVADQNGRVLGYATLSTLESMLPHDTDYRFTRVIESGASLGIWDYEHCAPNQQLESMEISVDLPLKRPEPIVRVVEVEDEFKRRVLTERIDRAHHLRQLIRDDNALKMPAWIWRLGDSYLVGVPGECYSEFQLKLRSRQPDKSVAVLNIANGYCGYMPPLSEYHNDNYEVQVSLLEAGCLEKLTEAVEKTISGTKSPVTNGIPAPHYAARNGDSASRPIPARP